MIPKPLRGFIAKLNEATDNGEVDWSEGAPDAYYCNHKTYQLHLSYRFDGDTGESAFNFQIKRTERDAFFSVTNDEPDYNTMKNLYASVSLKAADFEDLESDFFS